MGLSWCLRWWRICLQCRRPGFNPWVGKIPWRRERLPTPVFWPGEFHRLYISMKLQRVRQDWVTELNWLIQSMEFSRPEYWSGYPFPYPGDLPKPGLLHCRQILYQLSHQGSPFWISSCGVGLRIWCFLRSSVPDTNICQSWGLSVSVIDQI